MQVFLATNNEGKIDRYKYLLRYVASDIDVYTPADLSIPVIDVVENGKTLAENAKLKAHAYVGLVDMPIVSNDTGFYVEGEGFIDAPKRRALGETDERTLSKEEIGERLLQFWKDVATKHGGRVDAVWIEAFVAIHPDGEVREAGSRREVILTNQELGKSHIQMPVRALYYSKATNKPSVQHTAEEEIVEMQPLIDALSYVLGIEKV